MAKLSLSDVEREYVAWERAAVEQQGGYMYDIWSLCRVGPIDVHPTLLVEGDGSDIPDDYGIEYADTERLVHTPWACGFIKREAVIL